MKRKFMLVAGFAILSLLLLMTGCEWSSGGDSSWSDAPDWVNFSGVYRAIDGGALVTDYTTDPGTSGSTNNVNNEHFATANGSSTVYNGTVDHGNIQPGTVQISVVGFSLSDNGTGVLVGNNGSSGAVDYATGAISLDFGGTAPDNGDVIYASYQYVLQGSSGSGSAGPGTSGIVIYTFTVHQSGNKLTITDNNGSEYKGKFGSVESTTGGQGDVVGPEGDVTPATGTAVAQYSVQGVSAAGVNVTMTGTMQGELGGAGGTFMNRVMYGTWIEDPGRTGDIQGHASPLAVNNGN